MTASPSTTERSEPRPRQTYLAERFYARENLTTPIAERFEQDPWYLAERAHLKERLEWLVTEGKIAIEKVDMIEEVAFGMANAAANSIATAWWDTVTRAMLPDVAVTDEEIAKRQREYPPE